MLNVDSPHLENNPRVDGPQSPPKPKRTCPVPWRSGRGQPAFVRRHLASALDSIVADPSVSHARLANTIACTLYALSPSELELVTQHIIAVLRGEAA